MPRPLRIEYQGARYHVMSRGNRGLRVFAQERDGGIFLETLAEVVERQGWMVHAWVLMPTHYHLLLETPEANLVEGMKWLQGTFTQRHNSFHRTYGHLFQGRYKAKVIDDEDPSYFRAVADYIHLNPAEAGLLPPDSSDLAAYPLSSYICYLESRARRPGWVTVQRVLGCHGIDKDSVKGRRAFVRIMQERTAWVLEHRHQSAWQKEWRRYDRGWVHGTKDFRERMSELLVVSDGCHIKQVYDANQRRSYLQAAAEAKLPEALQVVGITEDDLRTMAKGDTRKMLLAGWLRKHFDVSNPWLSARLHMGHPSRVSHAHQFYRTVPRAWNKQSRALEAMLKF